MQTHPIDCTITALVILLIQATTAKDENIENNRLSYETNYIIQWNPSAQSGNHNPCIITFFVNKLFYIFLASNNLCNPCNLIICDFFFVTAKVLFKGKLQVASNKFDQVWNPTQALALSLQSMRLYKQDNPHLNNNQMVYDCKIHVYINNKNIIIFRYGNFSFMIYRDICR